MIHRGWIIAVVPAVVAGAWYWDRSDAENEADAFARSVARDMQVACVRDRKCPDAPAGWKVETKMRSITEVRGIRVDYRVLPDASAFRVSVYRVTGRILDIHGGATARELTEQKVVR